MNGETTRLEHFGLSEEPFGATPDPRFLYYSPQHTEALAALHYGVLERRGLVVLTARAGMGKTTLLNQLLEMWKGRAETAIVLRPPETREQMIAAVLEELGLASTGGYPDGCRLLEAMASDCLRKGKRLMVIFDEAQALPAPVLEEIRLLGNFETPEEKLVQIVLAGQRGLEERLAQPECEAFRQRAAIWARIGELEPAEVSRYVKHRLEAAGRKRRMFRNRAVALLAEASQGVPREINAICFEALSSAWAAGRKRIGEEEIRRAAEAVIPLETASLPGRKPVRRHRWAAAAAAAALAAVAPAWKHSVAPRSAVRVAPTVVAAAAPSPAVEEPRAAAEPAAVEPPATDPVDRVETVQVERGQTLRQIALRKYGRWDPEVWSQIQKSNPQLADPGQLRAGELLVLPEREEDVRP